VDTVEKHYKEFIDTAKSGAFDHVSDSCLYIE
jgi:hypothetical protein